MDTMRLLIGYDGSPSAQVVLEDLGHAGLPPHSHAIVLSIADMIALPPGGPDLDPTLPEWLAGTIRRAQSERQSAIEAMRSQADLAAGRLEEAFPTWKVDAEAHGDSPTWGIVKRSDDLHPDLVVLGSRGRAVVERLGLGSVSLQVLHAARCSVRIARSRPRKQGAPLGLLVGVDGSRHSLAAVRAVTSRTWPPLTQVRVVSALDAFLATAVVSPRHDLARWLQENAETSTWVHRMVEDLAQELRAASLDAEGVVLIGAPKAVLLEEAERWQADCVFLGSQGLNAVERLMLGSVSTAVAARAACSVEISRP